MPATESISQNVLNELAQDQATLSRVFKHYELRHLSAEHSGMRIFSAWDSMLCRMVSIKFVREIGEEKEVLLQEAREIASLTHSAFAKIHAIESIDDGFLVVSEQVVGTPLSDWIIANLGKEKHARDLIMQLADAIGEAHQKDLCHGDIKAANLMIDSSGKIRILEFGLRSHVDESSEITSVAQIDPQGSIAYMAPERFSGTIASKEADVYAMGTVFYQMVVGSLPHEGLNGLALVAAQVQSTSDQWKWPEQKSQVLRQLLLGMTNRLAEKRFCCAEVLAECRRLNAIDPMSNSATTINLSALQAQIDKSQRRRKLRQLALTCLLMTGVVVGAWQAKPYWPQIAKALRPYSEAKELEQGFQALTLRDKTGMLDLATQHYTTVLERNPNSAQAAAGISLVYSFRFFGDEKDEVWHEKAIASAQQALKLNKDVAIVQVAYALSLDGKEFDKAMAAIKRAKELEPHSLMVWQAEMRLLFLARRYDEALRFAELALTLFPNDSRILESKGIIYYNQAQYALAENVFKTNALANPEYASSYAFYAMTLIVENKLNDALEVYQRGLAVKPNKNLYVNLGDVKSRQGDFLGAVEAVEKAVSPQLGNPQDYDAWLNLGDYLTQVPGRRDDSIHAYEKAKKFFALVLKRSPNDAWFNAIMGAIEARLGRLDSAFAYGKRALELSPNHHEVHRLLAEIYELAGQRSEALTEIEIAKRLGTPSSEINSSILLKALRSDTRY